MDNKMKTVLVAEDDNALREIIINQLTREYVAIPAKDGQETLEQIKNSLPDILVLDILMPKKDGFQVLAELRTSNDPALVNLPVIVFSNLVDMASIQKVQAYNVLDFFSKSDVSLGTLANRIKRFFTQQSQSGNKL
ncbi:MAG TPA: response regulator [Candidatus Limnocylindria bacterium]|nr:response regulator [Candidatus Limnocylindria bacterium]